MSDKPIPIYETAKGDVIFVKRGEKSKFDFIVKYKSPGKRMRTPKHIHLWIDLYAKMLGNEPLTMKLVDHIIGLIERISPETSFPPRLQFFSPSYVEEFRQLEKFGEYSIEFILVVIELIMLQEKTNYPNGTLNLNGYKAIRRKADIFSIVSGATFTGRR